MAEEPGYAVRFRLKIKNSAHKRKYGVRLDERDALLAAQGGKCTICQAEIAFDRTSQGAHIDHCHTTGKRRDVLCPLCNLMLGHAQDQPERLEEGAAYLRRHAAAQVQYAPVRLNTTHGYLPDDRIAYTLGPAR